MNASVVAVKWSISNITYDCCVLLGEIVCISAVHSILNSLVWVSHKQIKFPQLILRKLMQTIPQLYGLWCDYPVQPFPISASLNVTETCRILYIDSTLTSQCKATYEQGIIDLWQMISHLCNDTWLILGLFVQSLPPCPSTCLGEIPPGIKIPRHANILFLFASPITSTSWTVLSGMPAKRQNTGKTCLSQCLIYFIYA